MNALILAAALSGAAGAEPVAVCVTVGRTRGTGLPSVRGRRSRRRSRSSDTTTAP